MNMPMHCGLMGSARVGFSFPSIISVRGRNRPSKDAKSLTMRLDHDGLFHASTSRGIHIILGNGSLDLKQQVLKDVFGFDSLRAGQEEVVDALLAGDHVLTVMPTGFGKSL
jgi:superfamily II DNA helicase RecQ